MYKYEHTKPTENYGIPHANDILAKFGEAWFFICGTDWNNLTYRRQAKYSAFNFLPDKQTSGCLYKTFYVVKVTEISGALFASCSTAPKRGKKCDEFMSLYQNIFRLLFCEHISLLQRKTTPLQIPPHMGKKYGIWRSSCVGSALARVCQPLFSERSVMGTYLFYHSALQTMLQFVS